MRRRGHRAAIHFLAAAFASAVLGDAFGAHECAHHEAMYGGAHPGEQHDDAPRHGPGGADSHDPAEHGPCTCVGDCHGGSATPLLGLDTAPVRVAQEFRQVRAVPASTRLLGERLDLYVLPLPNAPPVAG